MTAVGLGDVARVELSGETLLRRQPGWEAGAGRADPKVPGFVGGQDDRWYDSHEQDVPNMCYA